MLTPKQEKFAQLIAGGKSQADAYREAFNVRTTKPKTIHEAASKIASKVAPRIAELRSQVAEKALWTREMSVKALIHAYKEGSATAKVAAVRELNLMHGFNASDKHEHSGDVRLTLKIGGHEIVPEKLGWG